VIREEGEQMETRFRFCKLDVWKKAIAFADAIYDVTVKFPDSEKFGLTSQLRRASISISSNIAEGCSRSSDRDFNRFVEIAYGSLMETVSQLFIARMRQFASEADVDNLMQTADDLARMLSGLRKTLRARDARSK
jgi:four helix bundle protein